jgi:hypothetical protein
MFHAFIIELGVEWAISWRTQPFSLVKIKGKTKFEVDEIGGSHMFCWSNLICLYEYHVISKTWDHLPTLLCTSQSSRSRSKFNLFFSQC